MSKVIIHLSIFLVPIVLLSFNMEGIFEWRHFLIFEGVFCIIFFHLMSRVYESKVLIPACVLSTTMIALGLSSLESTKLGDVPAPVFMIPLIVVLAFIPKLSKATLLLIIVVGLSPIFAIFGASLNTGRGVIEGFGLSGDLRWYYPLAVAVGLLVSVTVSARVSKRPEILNLIPLAIAPNLLLTINDDSITTADLVIIVPLILLVVQVFLLLIKNDEFLSQYYKKVNTGFSIFLTTIEAYLGVFIAIAYVLFLADHSTDSDAFFTHKQGIGILLFYAQALFRI